MMYSWPAPRHLNVKIDSNNWQQLLVHLQELLWVLIAKTFHTSLKLDMSLNVQYWPGRTEGELRECWQLGCSSSRVMTDKINIEITASDDILSSPSPVPNPSPKSRSQIHNLFPSLDWHFRWEKLGVGGWLVACRIILSAPVPFLFLWTLDFGFGTWIWDWTWAWQK